MSEPKIIAEGIFPFNFSVRSNPHGRTVIDYAYLFPFDNSAFGLVGKNYYEGLRRVYPIFSFNLNFSRIYFSVMEFKNVILHPFFALPFGYGSYFSKLETETKIGVEVADSSRIERRVVKRAEALDLIIVPSKFSKRAFIRSGVKCPVKIVPHGIPDRWLVESDRIFETWHSSVLKRKYKIKALMFCLHSSYRKGFDLAIKVMREFQKIYPETVFVVKVPEKTGELEGQLEGLNAYIIAGWLSEKELLPLYRACDVYLLFSRGGSFELNGLEALACGEVVLACEKGAWIEYLKDWGVLIKCKRRVKPLPKNQVHVGYGYELDVDDAVSKLKDVVENLDDYKARVSEFPAEKWTWTRQGALFVSHISEIWGDV